MKAAPGRHQFIDNLHPAFVPTLFHKFPSDFLVFVGHGSSPFINKRIPKSVAIARRHQGVLRKYSIIELNAAFSYRYS
jgi:hypothetical protein